MRRAMSVEILSTPVQLYEKSHFTTAQPLLRWATVWPQLINPIQCVVTGAGTGSPICPHRTWHYDHIQTGTLPVLVKSALKSKSTS